MRSFVRSLGSDLRYFLPPDALTCTLHSLRQTPSRSIGSYSGTDVYVHACANVGREKCVYARMPRWERDEHKSRSSPPYAAHRSDASRGTAIDGCLLQLTCERRAACTLRASRWRARSSSARATGARIHSRPPLSPSRLTDAQRRERYYPVMDAPSVRHRGISRARHDHLETPSSSPPTHPAAARLNAPRRTCGSTSSVASHSSLPRGDYYVDRRPHEKASTREPSVVDNMAHR